MDETYLNAEVRLSEMERAALDTARDLDPVNSRAAGVLSRLADAVRAARREIVNAASVAAM